MVSPLNSMLIGAQGQNPLAGLGQQLSQNRAVNENILASEQNRGIQAQQAGIQQEQFQQQKAMQQLMFMNSMAKKMLNVDPSQWESMLTPYTQTLSEMGLDLRDLGQVTPEMLQGVIAQTDSALSVNQPTRQMDSVQSSEILPGGSVIKVMRSGNVVVEDSQGNPLSGDARQKVIDDAERRKIELAGQQARTVTGAKEEVKAEVRQAEEQRKNQQSYAAYQVGFDNLSKALGGTTSGPIVGRIPATTTNAQIAENARAILLPSLKSIFRSSGEGTFTDSDQRALEALIPNRSMTRDAQIANLQAIDALVKAKLGMTQATPEEQNANTIEDLVNKYAD